MVMIEWIDPSVDVYLQINKPTLGLGDMYNYMFRVCFVIRELVTSPTSLIVGHPFGCRTIHSNLYAHCYWGINQKSGMSSLRCHHKRGKTNQKCLVEKSALLPKQKAFCVDNLLLVAIWAFVYMNKWKQRSARD
jgi:hypothetical protein